MSVNDPAGSPGGAESVSSLRAEVDRLRDENVDLMAAGVACYDQESRQFSLVADDDPTAIARLRRLRTIATVVNEMLRPPAQPPDDDDNSRL